MASITTGQSDGSKRAIDHEIPLVPFIDLLLCCIMFLLVTAVWNQLSAITASTPGGGNAPGATDTLDVSRPLTLRLSHRGYALLGEAGDAIQIPKRDDRWDVTALQEQLSARRRVAPSERSVVVSADDGIAYADVMAAMDTLVGAGFPDVSLSGAP